MKEHIIPLLLSIVTTLLNYIFISAISAKQQQLIVADFKNVLNFMLEELKSRQDAIDSKISNVEVHILNEIKQSANDKK